jgi:hypothetical protein
VDGGLVHPLVLVAAAGFASSDGRNAPERRRTRSRRATLAARVAVASESALSSLAASRTLGSQTCFRLRDCQLGMKVAVAAAAPSAPAVGRVTPSV